MSLLDGSCREVLDLTEVVTIVTSGPDGPHLSATWGDYIRQLGFEGDRVVIPAGYMQHTEENLARDPRVQLLVASRRAEGSSGPGQGFLLKGKGRIVTEGEQIERVKAHFSWARAALVVQVEEAVAQL